MTVVVIVLSGHAAAEFKATAHPTALTSRLLRKAT
jgi:hypothetical protein